MVAAAAEACADRVVAAVAARVPSAESLRRVAFEPDAPERGRGYPKPPAAPSPPLRALVGCVSATGASGRGRRRTARSTAPRTPSGRSRAWMRTRPRRRRTRNAPPRFPSRSCRAPRRSRPRRRSAQRVSGGTRTSCSRSARGAARPSRRPRPSSRTRSRRSRPPARATRPSRPSRRCEAKPPRREARRRPVRKSPGWGLTAARCSLRRNATARVSSPALRTPRASRQRAARRRLRRRWRRVLRRVGDAPRPSRAEPRADSLGRRETPPSVSAKKWWAANPRRGGGDPLDEHVSPDGVPGDARGPLPRLLGLEPEPKRAAAAKA